MAAQLLTNILMPSHDPIPQRAALSAAAPERFWTVVLVDDHPMIRHGIRTLFNSTSDLRVVAEMETATEALERIPAVVPDLVILDLTLPDRSGIDVLRELLKKAPQLAVLVVSMHDERMYAERVLRAGARGYLMKGAQAETIVEATRMVLAGRVYVSSRIASNLLSHTGNHRRSSDSRTPLESLTDREFQIYCLIGHGKNTRVIAEEIGISPKTVDVHRANLKLKLGVEDMAALIRHAVCWVETQDSGLVEHESGR